MNDEIQAVVGTYLSAVDDEAPGLVTGLYLIGSAALGDYRIGRSDIDVVMITENRVRAEQVAALAAAHARLRRAHPRPHFDGPYLTWDDLRRPPEAAAESPYSHEGRFRPSGRFELTPVTWRMLAQDGVACRGPAAASLAVWADQAALTAWAAGNLDTYWRRWRDRCAQLQSRSGLISLGSWATEWGVLGVARQHHLMLTGDVISKSSAAGYALSAFGEQWHPIVRESQRLREGGRGHGDYRSPLARRRDMIGFISTVIDDTRRCRLP
jgi:hypothetical protein